MKNTNKGLALAERICFLIGIIVYFVATFTPLVSAKSGSGSASSTTSVYYLTLVGTIGYVISLSIFAVGVALFFLGDKKYFAFSSGLTFSSPAIMVAILAANLSSVTSSSPTLKLTYGSYFLFIAIACFVASFIIHGINALLTKEKEASDIDKRIELMKGYKEYLKEGIISEEEYEEKKKEIVGIESK